MSNLSMIPNGLSESEVAASVCELKDITPDEVLERERQVFRLQDGQQSWEQR